MHPGKESLESYLKFERYGDSWVLEEVNHDGIDQVLRRSKVEQQLAQLKPAGQQDADGFKRLRSLIGNENRLVEEAKSLFHSISTGRASQCPQLETAELFRHSVDPRLPSHALHLKRSHFAVKSLALIGQVAIQRRREVPVKRGTVICSA